MTAQGTATQVLVSNGTAAPAFIDQSALAVYGHGTLMSGYWYLPNGIGSTNSSSALIQSTLTFLPFYVNKATSINKLGIVCSATATSTTVRLGVYANTNTAGSVAPSALLVDAGTTDFTTTGSKVITLGSALSVTPGLYWLAAVAQGGQPSGYVTISSVNYVNMPVGLSSGALAAVQNNVWNTTGVTGALPNPVGGTAYPLSLSTKSALVWVGIQ